MTFLPQLSTLESAGLISLAQYEPDLEYLFRHILVQDAAYATLLPSDRRRLHRVVGEALEHLYPERLNEYAAVLARHFQRAGDVPRAMEYLIRAGDAALASYANQEAESQYRSALALPCRESQRADLLAGLGEALYRQSRIEEAIQTWRNGIKVYHSLGDMDGVARLYARSARAAWYADDTPRGLRLCQEGLDAVAGAPESPDIAQLMHETGRAYYFNGRPDEALPLCQQALAIAERLGIVDVQADALTTIGVLPNQPAEAALAALSKAVELAESAGLLQIAGRAHHNLGVITFSRRGELHVARDHSRRAVELARRRGVASEVLISLISIIGSSLSVGELAAAEDALLEVEALAEAMPDGDVGWTDLYSIQAGLLRSKGEWAEALRLQRLCLAEAEQRGNLQMSLYGATELASLLLELERLAEVAIEDDRASLLAEAEAASNRSITLADRGLGEQVWPHCQMSMVRARQGRLQEARHLLAEARDRASTSGSAWDEQFLRLAEAELARAEERWPDVLALTEAQAAFDAKRGKRWSWARTLVDWAELHSQRGEPADLQRAQALLREARSAFEKMGALGYVTLTNERLEALRTEMYSRALALSKASRELAVAGRIQEGLLPRETPFLPGWQLATTLEPARETSGDFYDFIPLSSGYLGLLVADVADKGAGAALYMALVRTLIRTYAADYPAQPALALGAANQRILAETDTDMFVTLFYGILEPATGQLTYCNAGHNPPYLLNAADIQILGRTGLPLGILEDAGWEQGLVHLAPGDALVLYTDGVTDTQNSEGLLFGQERLLAVIEGWGAGPADPRASALGIQEAILDAIHQFAGDAPQFDDLTLMVVFRE